MLNLRQYCFNSYIGITSEIEVEKLPVAYLTEKRLKHQIEAGERKQYLCNKTMWGTQSKTWLP